MLNKFFVCLLDYNNLVFDLDVIPLGSFHDFKENLVRTTPLFAKTCLFQESNLYIINAELSNSSFKMSIIIAIERGITASVVIELLPYFYGN